jgi:hypothetical protein
MDQSQYRGRGGARGQDKGNPGDRAQLSRGDITRDGIHSSAVFPAPISST